MNAAVRAPGRVLVLACLLALLGACSGGAETEPLQQTVAVTSASYAGPPPATTDVQDFQIELWNNIRGTDRCGACHTATGQAPRFARSDDVNLAWEAANTVVNLAAPGESRLVGFVASGHNCWLDSVDACADILTTWISNWAGGAEGSARKIVLQAPEDQDVVASPAFPEDPMLFASTVYPPLATYCAGCHASGASPAISPFFADGDLATAYDAVQPLLNLGSPALSRVVVRLRDEFHNCWTDCADDADTLEAAITAFAGDLPVLAVDPDLVLSKALTLTSGIVAAGGNRAEGNQIALYEFKTGEGSVAFDTSGVEPAMDLNLSGSVDWIGGWGLDLRGGKAQASSSSSRKLHTLITATGEYSLEAWAVPGNVNQEDAPIAALSGGAMVRNFALEQDLNSYVHLNRSSVTDGSGAPALATPDDDRVLQATLQHVVASFDPVNGRSLHVNGERIDLADEVGGGLLGDWDDTFAFVLGNEVSGDAPWQGVLRMVAVHDRVLSDEEVLQNMDAGVGERFFLLFDVSVHVGVPASYVLFEVSRFDDHAYLFANPRLINLDGNPALEGVRLADLRIGMNGVEVPIGQAFRAVDVVAGPAAHGEALGQALSGAGAVVPLERGPELDSFFLSFGTLGDATSVSVDASASTLPAPTDLAPQSRLGLRTFDRIDATMSRVTGVPATTASVRATFELVRGQLPGTDRLDTFGSARQIGVTQLAIAYCDVLVEDTTRRASYFPGFDFDASPAMAFSPAGRDAFFGPLVARMLGDDLATQPEAADVRTELDALVDRLAGSGSGPERTRAIGKAACSAVLAGAPLLLI